MSRVMIQDPVGTVTAYYIPFSDDELAKENAVLVIEECYIFPNTNEYVRIKDQSWFIGQAITNFVDEQTTEIFFLIETMEARNNRIKEQAAKELRSRRMQ